MNTCAPVQPGVHRATPASNKYCLWRQGLISSPECRLPLTSVSRELAGELDQAMDALARVSVTKETVERS